MRARLQLMKHKLSFAPLKSNNFESKICCLYLVGINASCCCSSSLSATAIISSAAGADDGLAFHPRKWNIMFCRERYSLSPPLAVFVDIDYDDYDDFYSRSHKTIFSLLIPQPKSFLQSFFLLIIYKQSSCLYLKVNLLPALKWE